MKLSFQELEEIFRGRFDELARQTCGHLIEPALAKAGRHVQDPVTGKPDSFRIHRDFAFNGKWYHSSPATNHGVFNLIEYVTGMSKSEIHRLANEIAAGYGYQAEDPKEQARRRAEYQQRCERERQARYAENRSRIKKALSGSINFRDLRAWPAHRYLAERGISLSNGDYPQSLGFHPAMKCFSTTGDKQLEGEFPVLLGKVTDVAGNLVSVHRTYLQTDGSGKAPVSEPKKMMPTCSDWNGASIKLFSPDADGLIAVAEGLETSLAVRDATGLPVWSTVHASGLSMLNVPQNVRMVAIFADKDRSEAGLKAAEDLKARLKKKGVFSTILMPEMEIPKQAKGVDWLDVLNHQGTQGFAAAMERVNTMRAWVRERLAQAHPHQVPHQAGRAVNQ